jgi:hypothetical protein
MTSRLLRRLGVLLVVLVAMGCPRAALADGPHETHVTATANAFVEVHVMAGAIRVAGWNRPEVSVSSTVESPLVTAIDGGARIIIRAPAQDEMTLDVHVPKGARLELRSVQGSVAVRDVEGPVQVTTVSGDVEVAGASSDVEVGSVSGDVTLALLGKTDVRATSISGHVSVKCPGGGSVFAKGVSGPMTIVGGALTRIEGRTISGEVTLDALPQGKGPFVLRAHSGPLRVVLPRAASIAVNAHSFQGQVDVDAADAGAIAAAATVLSLTTFSGDIRVVRR